MMLDVQNLCSDDQTVAIAPGSVLSDNSIDLGASATDVFGNTPTSDPGRSDVELIVQVTEDCDSVAEGATIKVELVTADNEALTSNLTVIASSEAIPENTAVAGYMFRLGCIPPGITQRYLGFRYTVATQTLATGKVTAGIVTTKQLNTGYAV